MRRTEGLQVGDTGDGGGAFGHEGGDSDVRWIDGDEEKPRDQTFLIRNAFGWSVSEILLPLAVSSTREVDTILVHGSCQGGLRIDCRNTLPSVQRVGRQAPSGKQVELICACLLSEVAFAFE